MVSNPFVGRSNAPSSHNRLCLTFFGLLGSLAMRGLLVCRAGVLTVFWLQDFSEIGRRQGWKFPFQV
eukprot:2612944-Amphidinium_carterae.1